MKKISLFLIISLFFSYQEANPVDGVLGKVIQLTVDVATSDMALLIYKTAAVTATGLTAKTLMEPALAKYRRATKTENVNEMHARVKLGEKFIELDQTDFQLQVAKIKVLADSFGDYQITMQKRLLTIKGSNAPEEEKRRLMLEIETRLKKTEEQLTEFSTKQFEKLVESTSEKLKTHLLEKAKTS